MKSELTQVKTGEYLFKNNFWSSLFNKEHLSQTKVLMNHLKKVKKNRELQSSKLVTDVLLFPGVWCSRDTVFVYSRVGGDTLLPCSNLVSSNCSLISWTFYKGSQVRYTYEVTEGQVRAGSDKSGRMSVTSDCSLSFRDLRVDDVGSYICFEGGKPINDVYVSLLAITALSGITDLQPGGDLVLSCILFSYYDTGSCQPYASEFSLSWVTEDGAALPRESRSSTFSHLCVNMVTFTFDLCGEFTFVFVVMKECVPQGDSVLNSFVFYGL